MTTHIVKMLSSDEGDLDLIADNEILEVIRHKVVDLIHTQLIGMSGRFDAF